MTNQKVERENYDFAPISIDFPSLSLPQRLVWCYFGDISKSRLHLTVMKRDVDVRFKCIWTAKSCVSVQNDMTFFPFLLSL